MIISDLSYLETTETTTVVGGNTVGYSVSKTITAPGIYTKSTSSATTTSNHPPSPTVLPVPVLAGILTSLALV